MKSGAVDVVALVFFASFAIDRITKGILFAISLTEFGRNLYPESTIKNSESERFHQEKNYRLLYFFISLFFAITTLLYYNSYQRLGILYALDIEKDARILDTILTGIILVAGSDFLGRLLEMSGAYHKKESEDQPIIVTGTLILEQPKKPATRRTAKSR